MTKVILYKVSQNDRHGRDQVRKRGYTSAAQTHAASKTRSGGIFISSSWERFSAFLLLVSAQPTVAALAIFRRCFWSLCVSRIDLSHSVTGSRSVQ